MDTQDIYVKEIVKGPYYYAGNDRCGWEIIIEVYCDGNFTFRTMTADTKEELEKYIPGYSWVE